MSLVPEIAQSPKLIANSFILLSGNIGSAILSFLLSIFIGRVTGETGLGIYAAVLAWVFPLSLVTEFGLGTLITREVAQFPEKAAEYLHSVTQARLIIGGSLMLVLVLIAPLLSQDIGVVQGIRVSAPLVIILPFYSSFTAIFRAYQRMVYVALLNTGMLISQVVLTALVFANEGDIQGALVVNTLTSAGQLVAAWRVYRWRFDLTPQPPLQIQPYSPAPSPNPTSPPTSLSKHGEGALKIPTFVRGGDRIKMGSNVEARHISLLPRKLSLRLLLKQGYPFAIAALLAAVQMRVNIILLENLSGAAVVGYYTAAQRFLDAGRMLPMALFDALFPLLSALAAQPEKLKITFQRVSLGVFGYGVLFGGIFSAFAAWIIALTYGAAFVPAVAVLQLAAWSLLPLILKQARTLYWYALKREQFVNRVTLFVLVLQIGLAVWLIPAYGAIGAVAASLNAETAAMLLLWFRR